jgi:DNA-binding response OmpR family regulator
MEVTDVALVRWPVERERLHALRASGEPRLVVVEEGSPPTDDDCLEDWLRAPVDVDELRARLDTLRSRALRHGAAPTVDEDGILRYRGRIVTLPPVQRRLADALLERRGSVVSRETLVRQAWPEGPPRHRNVLDVHVVRLRRLLLDVGLELTTVRRRGYLLGDADPRTEPE